MDHQTGKCSTALKTELATKSFFLQVFCLGWKMQHQDVCGDGRQTQLMHQFSWADSCCPPLFLTLLPCPHSRIEENALQLYVTDTPSTQKCRPRGIQQPGDQIHSAL